VEALERTWAGNDGRTGQVLPGPAGSWGQLGNYSGTAWSDKRKDAAPHKRKDAIVFEMV